MVSNWGGIGFLQELLRSCGKQSSVRSKVSITRERRTCWALTASWPKGFVIQLITILSAQPSFLLTSAALFLSLERIRSIMPSLFILLSAGDFRIWLSPPLAICQVSQVKVGSECFPYCWGRPRLQPSACWPLIRGASRPWAVLAQMGFSPEDHRCQFRIIWSRAVDGSAEKIHKWAGLSWAF